MSDESEQRDQQDELDTRRASALVKGATAAAEIGCTDCGQTVDVSDDETELEVLASLTGHQEAHHE